MWMYTSHLPLSFFFSGLERYPHALVKEERKKKGGELQTPNSSLYEDKNLLLPRPALLLNDFRTWYMKSPSFFLFCLSSLMCVRMNMFGNGSHFYGFEGKSKNTFQLLYLPLQLNVLSEVKVLAAVVCSLRGKNSLSCLTCDCCCSWSACKQKWIWHRLFF